jgi:carbonic anhydrase/acetyltransferase-like protein (isoleucine patch superfamily)
MLYQFDGKRPTVGKDSYVSHLARVIGDVVIGSNCYIGHGAILRGDYGRIEIREGVIVAEGAVVKLKQIVPPKVVIAGNPAQIVRACWQEMSNRW